MMSDTTSSDPGSSDPSRIERELDSTRSRLGSHLSELQDRLSPGQVLDDLMGYFRGSEGGDFARNLMDSVRGNPMPAALTGIGLAWLMAANPRPGATTQPSSGTGRVRVYGGSPGFSQGGYDAMAARVRAAEQSTERQQGEAEQAYTTRFDEARGHAIGLVRHAQESSDSFGQRIKDALGAAQQTVVEGAHDLRDQVSGAAGSLGAAAQGAAQSVGNAAQSVGSAAQAAAQHAGGVLTQGGQATGQAGSNLIATLAESPVLLGALGLAAGALLPQSDQEERALGGVAGQARDAARSLAQEAVDRGGRVATAVLDKGRDSVQSHGLAGSQSPGKMMDAAMSGELAGGAKQVVQDVLQAGDEAVRKEVLGQQGQGKPSAPPKA